MSLTRCVVIEALRGLSSMILRIDSAQLARIPKQGPLILIGNHVDLMEVPAIYPRLQPRRAIPLTLADRWNVGWSRFLLDVLGAIPIRRGESDVTAMRKGLAVLEAGDILFIAPEGTRSRNGRLQQGHPGVVLLALRSGAPLLPFAHYGVEKYRENLRRLRRTDFHVAVGRPFHLDPGGARVTHQVRQQMVDEIMYQIAALLPPAYRGVYSDMSAATEKYLAFRSD